jgi:hypothetical protein
MGFSLTWVAIKGALKEAALSALGLRGTQVFEEIPESPLTGVLLPSGWYMIVDNRCNLPMLREDKTLAPLSASADVVTCFVEEHVMCSSASQWRNGRELWSLMHTADTKGIDHLETKGELPSFISAIRERLNAKQKEAGGNNAEVDYIFDIPVEAAKHLTGYRHDFDIPELRGNVFEVLATTEATPKRSWLRKLIGF